MTNGDICVLINPSVLKVYSVDPANAGRRVVLHDPTCAGWYYRYEGDLDQWWAPKECFQSTQPERKKANGMRTGDRATLCDVDSLRIVGLASYLGRIVTLGSQRHDDSWNFQLDGERGYNYWAPARCFRPVVASHYRPGDKCRLIDIEALRHVSMGGQHEKICTLKRLMSQSEKEGKSSMSRYAHEHGWWVHIEGTYQDYYVPQRCLLLAHRETERGESRSQLNNEDIALLQELERNQTTQTERKIDMYLYNVTVIKTPSTLAQQAGEIDTILCGPTPVLAKDEKGAALKMGAINADVILKEDKSMLRIVMSAGV